MRSLAAGLPVRVLLIGLDDTVRTCNEPAARLLELPSACIVGGAFRDLEASFRIPGLRAAVEGAKAGTSTPELFTTYPRGDGAPIVLRATIGPVAEDGGPRRAVSATGSRDHRRERRSSQAPASGPAIASGLPSGASRSQASGRSTAPQPSLNPCVPLPRGERPKSKQRAPRAIDQRSASQ